MRILHSLLIRFAMNLALKKSEAGGQQRFTHVDLAFRDGSHAESEHIPKVDIDQFSQMAGLKGLARKAKYRFPHQPEQPDLMPDLVSFNSDIARHKIIAVMEEQPVHSRRKMEGQLLNLKSSYSGRPEILLWHSLAISYLRRKTPHTEKARALFFKIWDEQYEWLADNLNARWLISALQTFADHGRTPRETQCGAVGFMYGNLIKVYESEIASVFHQSEVIDRYKSGKIRGLFEFQPGDDILLNINTFAYAAARDAGPAGLALSRLLLIVKEGESIFSRTDAVTLRNGGGRLSFTDSTET